MPREKVLNIHELQQSHVNYVNNKKKNLAFFKVVLLAVMGQGLTSKLGTESKVVVGFLQQFADTPHVSLHFSFGCQSGDRSTQPVGNTIFKDREDGDENLLCSAHYPTHISSDLSTLVLIRLPLCFSLAVKHLASKNILRGAGPEVEGRVERKLFLLLSHCEICCIPRKSFGTWLSLLPWPP